MNSAYSPEFAWEFGLERVLDALEPLVHAARGGSSDE